MKAKKIKLENISLESFVTKLESGEKQTIAGEGVYKYTVDWPCRLTDFPYCVAVTKYVCTKLFCQAE